MTARVLSLCSGYGGLDLAVEDVYDAVTVAHAEFEDAPSKVLAARWPGVPNLGDITRIDWDTVAADIFTAGYPCQPFSLGGKRKGTSDDRHLWPHIADGIRRVRPRLVVLENVAGHRSMGFDAVLGDLAADGYDAQWTSLRAADVGAPHGRERLFILAADTDDRRRGEPDVQQRGVPELDPCGDYRSAANSISRGRAGWASDAGRCTLGGTATPRCGPVPRADVFAGRWCACEPAADASSDGRNERWPQHARLVGGPDVAERRDALADPDCDALRVEPVTEPRRSSQAISGQPVQWGTYEPAIRRWERLTRPAPAPTETGPKGGQRLSPRFVEWMMGLPAGWCTDIPGLTRNALLKMLGNGVVPQQAIAALRQLHARAQRAA